MDPVMLVLSFALLAGDLSLRTPQRTTVNGQNGAAHSSCSGQGSAFLGVSLASKTINPWFLCEKNGHGSKLNHLDMDHSLSMVPFTLPN